MKHEYIAPAIYPVVDCGEDLSLLEGSLRVDTTDTEHDPNSGNEEWAKQSWGVDFGNAFEDEEY